MSNPKILVVDDEPFNVDYIEQELEEKGYEVLTAENGQKALETVQSDCPDLILLDIMMPVMDGFEVLRHLKRNPVIREIPVIVISANNDLSSVVQGIQMGAEDYLPKPFEPTLLYARITSSLEKKRLHDLEHLYLQGLERELDIARDIQKGFLPADLPRIPGWKVDASFQAAREVAGDFYDAFLLPDGNLVCVVGDVCGKGVGAALFMTLFRSLIRAACTMDIFYAGKDTQQLSLQERIAKAISFTNSYIYEVHGDSSMFATVFIGAFDIQRGTLVYINCGNEAALILRNGCVVATLKPTAPVVGIYPEQQFCANEFFMEKNDLVLAYTDGIPDARNADDASFGKQGLLNLLDGMIADPTMILHLIQEQLNSFIGSAEQFDDITLVAVQRKMD